jgi:hypothetical protein
VIGKLGKETSASPGLGSGADSSTTTHNRRGRPGNNAESNGNGATAREPTMTELKKRANLMLQYISQVQIGMASTESRGLSKEKSPTIDQSESATILAGNLATKLVKWQQDFTVDASLAAVETGSAKS